MNSHRMNSTSNKNQLTGISSHTKKTELKQAGETTEDLTSAVKMKTGRKRILFHLLIGYQ
jgi:hypothetical protein